LLLAVVAVAGLEIRPLAVAVVLVVTLHQQHLSALPLHTQLQLVHQVLAVAVQQLEQVALIQFLVHLRLLLAVAVAALLGMEVVLLAVRAVVRHGLLDIALVLAHLDKVTLVVKTQPLEVLKAAAAAAAQVQWEQLLLEMMAVLVEVERHLLFLVRQ
jgi:hypothetical protein